ncbi:MAG: 7-cyano-7-deazaguanine synthase, partial [Armatimonadota bacterium]
MSKRVVVVASGMPPEHLHRVQPGADVCIDWTSDRRNALVSISEITSRCQVEPPGIIQDLFDIAVAVYLADIAILRGKNEDWTRSIDLLIPVRDPAFWQAKAAILNRTLHELTRDNFSLEFTAHSGERFYEFDCPGSDTPDCVSALSGGIDSMAGAVMLLRADRRPLLITHQSGNPYVRRARDRVVETLDEFRPGQSTAVCATIQPRRNGDDAWSFPPAEQRENSRRSRAFLFISLTLLAAVCAGVSEVYVCDNGVLTVALPLTDGRVGSLSTRSTHPVVIAGINSLLEGAGVSVRVANPFVYQTKAELIGDILRPVLTPAEIQQTVSCWMTGRRSRQCGGCIPCLLRRISMLAAGLP